MKLPPLCIIISVTEKSSGFADSNPNNGSDSLSRLAALVPLLTGTSLGDSETCSLPAWTRTQPESVDSLNSKEESQKVFFYK